MVRRFRSLRPLSLLSTLPLLCLLALFLPRAAGAAQGDALHQLSCMQALSAGVYDGARPLEALRAEGDFGIGTFQNLDGDMIYLEGLFYQVRGDGWTVRPDARTLSPFAMIVRFHPDRTFRIGYAKDYEGLRFLLDGSGDPASPTRVGNPNCFQAIRIDGRFPYLRVRSVDPQKKPYPPLTKALQAGQRVWERRDVEGTLVGFRCPAYVGGVNAAGYHFHFLSKDRTFGGHMLECTLDHATAQVQELTELRMILPDTEGFRSADLSPTGPAEAPHNP
jgi:acetolactate decarboxylase